MILLFLFFTSLPYLEADTIPHACSTTSTSSYPFCDTSLSIPERVDNLISLLTLDEKSLLLTARESPLNWIPRLGIPEYDWGGNCIHGVQSRCGSKCPTIFPEPNGLGATFNRTLIRQIFSWVGMELRALWLEGIGENHKSNLPHFGLDCWSPTINLGRDPRWGRMYEVPSEDPIVNGEYGKYYVLGSQNGSKSLPYYDSRYYLGIATLKHFDAYSLERYKGISRHRFNANVSDYMFSDSYWPAFKTTVSEGGALGVMCSYNAINGIPACCNEYLLNKTLRYNWGFNGYITSDSGAIQNIYDTHHYANNFSDAAKLGLEATCDIDSCLGHKCGGYGDYGTDSPYTSHIKQLIESNSLDSKYLNMSLKNSLTIRFKLGLFDPIDNQSYWNIPGSIINQKSTQLLNLNAAEQTMTLLKNVNNTLPFNANDGSIIGVIGPHFNVSKDMISSYTGQPCYEYGDTSCIPSFLNELEKVCEESIILAAEGCNVECLDRIGFDAAYAVARKADKIILMMGINTFLVEGEGKDRYFISLPGFQYELAYNICIMNKPTVLVLINGGMVSIDGLKDVCPSILEHIILDLEVHKQ